MVPCFSILRKIPALLRKQLKFPNAGNLSALIGDFIINVEKLIWNKYFIMGDCTEAKEPICVLAPG